MSSLIYFNKVIGAPHVEHAIKGAKTPDIRSTGTIDFTSGQNLAALVKQIDPNNLMGSVNSAIEGLIGIQGIDKIASSVLSGNLNSITSLLSNAAQNQLNLVTNGSLGQLANTVNSITSLANTIQSIIANPFSTILGGGLGTVMQQANSFLSNTSFANTAALNKSLEDATKSLAIVNAQVTQFKKMFEG